ncbi:hypothetical protein BO94DRAFT_524377 [Aspergillus sclerotioniger CBS 115572]|uniref:Zn(2)-C6 fungal-type domain-containing protein n=1 Tax=Aspergillus sclerotioniger CBS 115572 TaxID=1450535 RepID=A0A317VKU3_9EURO|nr:hypothetical protein BO94DRAFT_524377 [Aspergillus sclerotioniger CBS 115572]PWY74515.1 hypothetical protein BO94DRAFT_524377 [Aspergillus sclerotioniger CBS 115572]
MVYRGKPGLGCELCRKRRLACDRRRPSCSQCLRINQECSGYRDPNTLRILDQTNEVAVKAHARRTASKSPPADRSTPPAALLPPPTSPDEQAMSYVFNYYVGTLKSQGVMPYLSDLLRGDPSPALQATVRAVGLANMSREPQYRRLARKEYGVALRATNDALTHSVSATSDSTLAAVLLLSTYEMITCSPWDKLSGWNNHVQGAIKLLELRGLEQLDSRAGMELFTTVRFQSAISSIFYRISSNNTPRMAELSIAARSKRNPHFHPIEDFYDILLRLGDLAVRVESAHLGLDFIKNLRHLIDEAILLDADMELWRTSLSPFWYYTMVEIPHTPSKNQPHFPHRGDKYHLYHNVNLASIWNNYRQTRIVVNEMLRFMSLRMWRLQRAPEYQQTMSQCMETIQQMVDDICASIPYHFISGETGFGASIRLLWPLYIAGSSKCTDSSTREWIAQILDVIGNTVGLQQALSMAQIVREEASLDVIAGKCS